MAAISCRLAIVGALLICLASTASAHPATKVVEVPEYGQCGGKGGMCNSIPGATCTADAPFPGFKCTPAFTCSRGNEWYWQCVPGTAPVGSSTPPQTSPKPSTNPAGNKVIDLWGQCGGAGGICKDGSAFPCVDAEFPGYSCAAGSYCSTQSKWYRQCVPGTSNPTSTTSPSPSPSVTPTDPNVIAKYGQCGGLGGSCKGNCVDGTFAGTSCEKGSTCQKQNQYYYQCL